MAQALNVEVELLDALIGGAANGVDKKALSLSAVSKSRRDQRLGILDLATAVQRVPR